MRGRFFFETSPCELVHRRMRFGWGSRMFRKIGGDMGYSGDACYCEYYAGDIAADFAGGLLDFARERQITEAFVLRLGTKTPSLDARWGSFRVGTSRRWRWRDGWRPSRL